ncbi:MAG: hypothetical protein MJ198_02515 [Bacteroidales bacterium]|nr:hypothetical protein [Bacteroidales bacterium]
MLNNEDEIEQFFNDRFKDAEVAPSNDIWTKLESDLEKQDVEGLYQAAFQNAAVEPSSSVWRKISAALAWRSFLTFNFTTFNIYYASVITAIVGFSVFSLLREKTNDADGVMQTEVLAQSSENISKIDNLEDIQDESIENKTVEYSQVNQIENSDFVQSSDSKKSEQNTEYKSANEENSKKRKDKDADERKVDWSHVRIVGNNSICKDIPSVYSVEGLNEHADIQWNLPKAAKKNSNAGHNISIIWIESGQQTLSANVKVSGEKKTIDFSVNVEGVAVPNIKGKVKVCQGMEKQLYYVDETINKEISYLWESQQNTIDQIGNKYINVDWTKSGKDTLSVTKINTITGCKSQAEIGIVVYPQPKIDFEYYPLGDQEYEFAFTETPRKGYSYEWLIEGVEYDEQTVIHEASGTGSSFATLKVTDKNGCISKVQKEVDFNKNFIAIPSKYSPSSGKYFMPLTNAALQSYRMEIYNARNEKVWESTELANGKPAAGWDGKFRGANLPRGKYMWKIYATFDDGTQWKGVTQPNGSCRPNGIFILEN